MRPAQDNLMIVIPVYNDWSSLSILIQEIDRMALANNLHPQLVIIDDGSNESCDGIRQDMDRVSAVKRIDIIHLARNLGHQKAIALGLAYIKDKKKCDHVIVMDGDGEDRPENIPQLLDEQARFPDAIIFAQRTRRSEGPIFLFFYAIYRLGFFLLTGTGISFGNFACIPSRLLERIVYLPEIWNHFAAGAVRSKLPRKAVPIARGHRYAGQSKMNFVSLILHGLSAISVFTEILTVRLILLSMIVILLVIVGFIILLYIKYFTVLAIPGWATSVAIGLVLLMFQAVVFLILLSFLVLNYRTTKVFIPAKDYEDYIYNVEQVL
jgi:polyisoprenyl-phosphate glycosyltransferase